MQPVENGSDFKKAYNNIADDVEAIVKSKVTRNRKRMVEILNLLKEIIAEPTDEKAVAEPGTKDIPELEKEEPAEQKGVRVKILTSDQLLSRLPIILALLKAQNNLEKLKNEIRQLL